MRSTTSVPTWVTRDLPTSRSPLSRAAAASRVRARTENTPHFAEPRGFERSAHLFGREGRVGWGARRLPGLTLESEGLSARLDGREGLLHLLSDLSSPST